ncbi:alanine--tRNA ligase [Arcobacter sp. 15-2]|uniref:alanine--tRNA ligase n=1 Tax=Arcobacter sp. 15-2 TaxID=3374109 RepID=UPI00399CA571
MNIRNEFLEFFVSKQHEIIKSAPLVPDDSTLLFTNAGMVQFKDIFTGAIPAPKTPRATSCQLCVRAGGKHNDLENVGYTARHHTLFEMLGNFSFGDYFKEEAIANAWEFITKNLELPEEKLWVTVHDSDDEAFELWTKHISSDRIMRFGDKDNFWSMGDTGACGPCSEIFYDQGAEKFNSPEDKMGGEGDRFLEIWNLVFMQYDRDEQGNLNPLPKPSIDTGMGLERVVAIKEGVSNNFDSSTFQPIIKKIEKICDTQLTQQNIASFRVIADHVRTVTFMLSQGILFDKVGRGYVARRILRRAVRHGYLLGFRKAFMTEIIDTLCEMMGDFYPELLEKKEFIQEQVKLEEDRFFKTISSGMELFNAELENTKEIFSGEVAFNLYDTHGFPLDLTEDMLREKNLQVDNDTFDKCMNQQKAKAKSAWKGSGDDANEGDFKQVLDIVGINKFVGYTNIRTSSKIIALLNENFKQVETLSSESIGWVMLDKTPFYATSGGQNGDVGALEDGDNIAIVKETKKFFEMNMSKVEVSSKSSLKVGSITEAVVVNRGEVSKHHSATHLLQSALKMVLGDTVSQAGSLNDEKRLRFDFTYPKAMTSTQIEEVQDLVNSMIARGLKGSVEELPIEEAKTKGAIAMFGEKYGDSVRVVEFGDVSVEFCGGTHVQNTGEIGSFYITKESGVSAGVRRIEAVVGLSAIAYVQDAMKKLSAVEAEVKNKDIIEGISKLKKQIKDLKTELKVAHENVATPLEELDINGVKVIVDIVENGDIKKLVDDMKNGHDKIATLLLQVKGDKVMLVSGVKNADAKAGDWIKTIAPIVGGGGGGRPDFAQAGGKDASKIKEAKIAALEYIKSVLN